MKTILKRVAALTLAVLMLSALAVPASADTGETVTSATEMNATYFQTLKSDENTNLTGSPSLTIAKYQAQDADPAQANTSAPIKGVEFKYVKVGGLYELKVKNADNTLEKTVMAYGVTKAFADAISLTGEDYACEVNQVDYVFFTDGSKIQTATRGAKADKLNAAGTGFLNTAAGVQTGTTGDTGTFRATLDGTNSYGLYLVVETDVSRATIKENGVDKAIAITQVQSPFIVSLPTLGADNFWDVDITANVKNSTGTATVEKKIVVEAGQGQTDPETSDNVDDTDITHIGDTVRFRLKGTVPAIPRDSSIAIEHYVLTDQISKGLTPNLTTNFEMKLSDETELTNGTHFIIAETSLPSLESPFVGGKEFTITFTEAGLGKLTEFAKSSDPTKAVYFYYDATVNTDAVIGTGTDYSGNPNRVKLTYRTTGGSDMNTEWDNVAEFTFGIDLTKQFQNATATLDATAVSFKIYKLNGETKVYYSFLGSDGVYHTPGTAADVNGATELKLDSNKKISIKGLDEGTYYIEETATAPGYNLLKEPVKVVITPDKGTNSFVGTADQYMGTFTFNSQPVGTASITVVNTQGFTLPSTGGAGIWMFVLGGIVFIAAGCAYFLLSKKRRA